MWDKAEISDGPAPQLGVCLRKPGRGAAVKPSEEGSGLSAQLDLAFGEAGEVLVACAPLDVICVIRSEVVIRQGGLQCWG